MSTAGRVYAKAPFASIESYGDGWYGWWETYGANDQPPETLADRVAAFNAARSNSTLLVAYDPQEEECECCDGWYGYGEPWGDEAVVAEVATDQYLTGYASKAPIRMYFWPWGRVSGEPVRAHGYLSARLPLGDDEVVHIFKREIGQTADTWVADIPVIPGTDGCCGSENQFFALVPGPKFNATYTATWDGNDDYLSTSVAREVTVGPKLTLKPSVSGGVATLTARLAPKQPSGKVEFQRKSGNRWVRIARAGLTGGGRYATVKWSPKAGTYQVRCRFTGSELNGAAWSKAIKVVVK
jgi:hypothetical protein